MRRPARRRFGADQKAISSVIGAFLLLGILTVTLIKFQTEFVPVWDEKRESAHSSQVSNQMAVMASDMARLVGNISKAGVTDPVTLGSEGGFSFFQSSGASGVLQFTPGAVGAGLELASIQLTLQERNGAEFFSHNEVWSTVSSGSVVEDIMSIQHLRVRIADPEDVTGTMTIRFTDSADIYQAKVWIIVSSSTASGAVVQTAIYGPNSETEAVAATSQYFPGGGCGCLYPYFFLDALDDSLQFTGVLQTLNYPVKSTMTLTGDVAGDYAIVYEQPAPVGLGTVRVGTQGVVIPDYSERAAPGMLSIAIQNVRFPSQTYSFEYGAIILEQGDGAAMASPPMFSATSSPTQTFIKFTAPGLIGPSNVIQGSTQAGVTLTPANSGVGLLMGFAPSIVFEVPTEHPELWESFWDQTLTNVGLNAALGEFVITTTATSATLEVYGPITDPADLTNDVLLDFQQANLKVEIQASG